MTNKNSKKLIYYQSNNPLAGELHSLSEKKFLMFYNVLKRRYIDRCLNEESEFYSVKIFSLNQKCDSPKFVNYFELCLSR